MSDALSKKEEETREKVGKSEKERERRAKRSSTFAARRHSRRKSTREFMRPPGETGHTSGGKRAPRTYWKIIRQSELRAQEGDGERRENARVIPEIYYRLERGADLLLEFRESKWKGVDFRRLDGERPAATRKENVQADEKEESGEGVSKKKRERLREKKEGGKERKRARKKEERGVTRREQRKEVTDGETEGGQRDLSQGEESEELASANAGSQFVTVRRLR